MNSPRLKFVGAVPVDIETLMGSLEVQTILPATVAGSLPLEIPLGVFNTRNPVTLLEAVTIVPQAAVTADATNYITITIVNKGQAGSGTTVLASWSTQTSAQGALTAYVPSNLNIPSTNAAITPGDVLIASVVKAASGQNLPACSIQLKFKE